jgi:hypothetical protein
VKPTPPRLPGSSASTASLKLSPSPKPPPNKPDSADVHAVLGPILLASGRIPEGQKAMAEALHLAQTNHPDFLKYLTEEIQHPSAHS